MTEKEKWLEKYKELESEIKEKNKKVQDLAKEKQELEAKVKNTN